MTRKYKEFDEKFEWLAQDIWNPKYPEDKKWDYALYLCNVLKNRYEESVDNLVDDINNIYPDIAKEVNLPGNEFEYNIINEWVIEEVIEDSDSYSIILDTKRGVPLYKEYWVTPKTWDIVTVYFKWISCIVWLDINWKRIFSKNKKTVKKEDLLWFQTNTKEELKKYDDTLNKVKKFYDNLPDIFKNEFDELFDWWVKNLDKLPVKKRVDKLSSMLYNIFTISKAVEIIKSVNNKNEIEKLKNASDEEIKKKIPSFFNERHSWNTFYWSFAIAKAYYDEIKKELD